MALQKDFTTHQEFNVPGAYYKLMRCSYDGDNKKLLAAFSVFKDSTKEIQVGSYGIELDPDMTDGADNFAIQAYNEFKTHNDMSGAIDI